MADASHRSYLRDSHGPRAIDVGSGKDKSRTGSKRLRETEDRGQGRSKHSSSRRSSKPESRHQRKPAAPPATIQEQPSLELDVIGQPPRNIVFGTAVETLVLVSLKLPSPDMAARYRNYDTSRLLAAVSLVTDTRSGTMPLEYGTLTGQKMIDSVHPLHGQSAENCSRPCRLALGYFQFPGLLIRQTGTYRVRTTLCSTGTGVSGAESLLQVDSHSIKVDRWGRSHRE